MTLLPQRLRGVVLAVLALLAAPATCAIDQDELLPVDTAFVLSAEASTRDAIDVRWTIAEGYYLYRHRTHVEVLGDGFAAGELLLPPGKAHTDEFFGDVETYRDVLVATLPGTAAADAASVRLRVKYQGCADLGICYPPQTREIDVTLPTAATAPGVASIAAPALAAAPADDLSGLLSGGPRGSRLLEGVAGPPGLTATGPAGMPLPETEAYIVEAVTDGPNRIVVRFTIAPGYYLYRDKTRFAVESGRGATIKVDRKSVV